MLYSVKKNYKNNESGQVLLVIFVLMLLALSIGLFISSRYIKNLSSLTQTDQSSKAVAIAESAIEHLLILPISTLQDYAINNTCQDLCRHEIVEIDGQIVYADVKISILGNSQEPYILDLTQNNSMQINLAGYPSGQPLLICWNGSDMSITGMYVYGLLGEYQADAFSYNAVNTSYADNGFTLATASSGFDNCFEVTSADDSQILRIKSLYSDGTIIIIPASGASLPTQGILLESHGVAGKAEKFVSVLITDPILPSDFDYVIYQKSATEPLSN